MTKVQQAQHPADLATDVGSGAAVKIDVEVVSGATGVLANESRAVGFSNGDLQVGAFLIKLA